MISTGEHTVRAGRHDVRVSVEGSPGNGDGPPLLLINGLGGVIRMWDPLRQHLAGTCTIAFDAPGAGDSPTPTIPQSVVGVARMITRLLDELELPEIDVLGYSLGGVVAQQLAWTSPRRVRRVVLLSTNTGWGSVPSHPVALKGLFSMKRLRDPEHYAALAPQLLGGALRHNAALARRAGQLRTTESPDTRGYLYQLLSCTTWSTMPMLRLIRQPTLVVNGDDDPLARPVNAKALACLIPNAELHLVRGAGHHLFLERPDEVSSVVAAFLECDGLPSSGPT
ncbi:alpha/beta hydrolase [Sporichthya sp.]|uniref:alpha/beta fold hydrolase n=1 Tax=Sporichthya sp. TaxID=65475 RepID=UPI0017D06577|nr:alpha/beta hydrolase [Sporichthya sp.]MBA3743687.1 alpha/beta fold hydrolase [Sporichthya sp.]